MPPVIRASGGRCDITRCVPLPARNFARFCARRPNAHAGRRAGEADCDRRARRRSPARRRAGAHRQCRPRRRPRRSWPTIWRRSSRTGCPPARWRALLDREIDALAAAGLIAASGRSHRSQRGRRRPRRHLPRAQGQPAARRGTSVRDVRLIAKALGLEREAGQAPHRAGDARRPARGDRAEGLRPQDQGRAPRPSRLRAALAAVALARAFGNQIKAGLPARRASRPRPAGCWPRSSRKKPRDFGTDSRLDRRACRRARRRRADRPRRAAPRRAAPLSRRRRRSRRSAGRRLPPPRRPRRVRAWSSPRPHAPPPTAAGRISPASPRRCAGTPATRRKAGPATARPTSATCGTRCASRRPEWGSPRSSSNACWPRRTAPAASRSPTPT